MHNFICPNGQKADTEFNRTEHDLQITNDEGAGRVPEENLPSFHDGFITSEENGLDEKSSENNDFSVTDNKGLRKSLVQKKMSGKKLRGLVFAFAAAVLTTVAVASSILVTESYFRVTYDSFYFEASLINPDDKPLVALLLCDSEELRAYDISESPCSVYFSGLSPDTYYEFKICDPDLQETYFAKRFKTESYPDESEQEPAMMFGASIINEDCYSTYIKFDVILEGGMIDPDNCTGYARLLDSEGLEINRVYYTKSEFHVSFENLESGSSYSVELYYDGFPIQEPYRTLNYTLSDIPDIEFNIIEITSTSMTFQMHCHKYTGEEYYTVWNTDGTSIFREYLTEYDSPNHDYIITVDNLKPGTVYTLNIYNKEGYFGDEGLFYTGTTFQTEGSSEASEATEATEAPGPDITTDLQFFSASALTFRVLIDGSPDINYYAQLITEYSYTGDSASGESAVKSNETIIAENTLYPGENILEYTDLLPDTEYMLKIFYEGEFWQITYARTEACPAPTVTMTRVNTSWAGSFSADFEFESDYEEENYRIYITDSNGNISVPPCMISPVYNTYSCQGLVPGDLYTVNIICTRIDEVLFTYDFKTVPYATFETTADGITICNLNGALAEQLPETEDGVLPFNVTLTNKDNESIFFSSGVCYSIIPKDTYHVRLDLFISDLASSETIARVYEFDTEVGVVEKPVILVDFTNDGSGPVATYTLVSGDPTLFYFYADSGLYTEGDTEYPSAYPYFTVPELELNTPVIGESDIKEYLGRTEYDHLQIKIYCNPIDSQTNYTIGVFEYKFK